jgi:hypothetical protein
MWKEAVVALLGKVSQHLPARINDNQEKSVRTRAEIWEPE